MKKTPLLIAILLITAISCKDQSSQVNETTLDKPSRTSVKLELKSIAVDSISIRSLDFNEEYWFAASKNTYGTIDPKTNAIESFEIDNDTTSLEFRSIAVTENFTYILNAGAPAHIFKINHATMDVHEVYTENGEGVFYDSMKFWNDEEGIVFGDPTAQGQSKCISILKTIDGGSTWKKISCERLPDFVEGEAGFAASNSNIVLGGDKVLIATGGAAARVLYSKDRGERWTVQETPIVSGGQMTGIFAMDFYNKSLGIIVGGDWSQKENNSKNMAITNDGGATWNLLAEGSGPGYCSDVLFIPGTEGREILALATQGVWWSGDQGTTWHKLSDEGFYTAAMKNSREGVLTGYAKAASFQLLEQKK
ncbi:MAG: exo-alpha-sialidase [Nonlabens sp.]